MTNASNTRTTATTADPSRHDTEPARRSTETKSAAKTTEFFVYIATVVAIIITAAVVGADNNSRQDPFGAFQALQLITLASVGYLIARGLAKSGSREHYSA